MTKSKSDYSIQTVRNALRLLETFFDEEELGVSELSRRLGLHKNNVFRLLATLEQAGYVDQSAESERYRLGARCVELGRAYGRGHALVQRARPVLESLVEELGETAHLGVLRDFEVVHLDGVQPDRMVLTALRIGHRLPAHCTALGKVLLGCADQHVRADYDRRVIEVAGLAPRPDGSTIDRHKFFEELRSIAVQGFALDLEECQKDLRCAAAPVYDASGRVVGALSVSGPAFRLSEDALHRMVSPVVTAAAAQLSQELGAL